MKTLTITIQVEDEFDTELKIIETRIRDMIRDEIEFELGLELEDFTTYEIK